MASQRRIKVLENYLEPDAFSGRVGQRQFQPRDGAAYQKLRSDMIYVLLERSDKMHNAASMPNLISPRKLLERMSNEAWTCAATAHEGGIGDAQRAPDPYLHFNIKFRAKPHSYHVRCHELKQGGLLVFQVSY